jgi:hypothetical protein
MLPIRRTVDRKAERHGTAQERLRQRILTSAPAMPLFTAASGESALQQGCLQLVEVSEKLRASMVCVAYHSCSSSIAERSALRDRAEHVCGESLGGDRVTAADERGKNEVHDGRILLAQNHPAARLETLSNAGQRPDHALPSVRAHANSSSISVD